MTRSMRGVLGGVFVAGLVTLVAACEEQSPTSIDPGDVPVEAITVELELPWSEFGDGIRSFGGFGSAADIPFAVVAEDLGGLLDARALVQFAPFPTGISVRDPSGLLVTDTLFTILSGQLIARTDSTTAAELNDGDLTAGVLTQSWDPRSATWEAAVDSIGERVLWEEPGGGPVRPIGPATVDPSEFGDSILFEVDEATLIEWSDSTSSSRTARFDLSLPDRRVQIREFLLRLQLGSSVAPDTTVVRDVDVRSQTFIYTPEPGAPGGVIRVGGIPSWRSVVGLDVPTVLTGPEALCDVAGCPFRLTAESLSRASLVLTSRETEPSAFQPVDSVFLDVRPVLAPEALPRSPLGASVVGERVVGPASFGEEAGTPFEIPITGFVRRLLDEESGSDEPTDLALLGLVEPIDFALAEFDGPDGPGAPVLRLLITVADSVRFR